MNGTKAILDSNTVIFATRAKIDVEELFSRYDQFHASIITYIEVYAFDFHDASERAIADEIFANLEIIDATQEIADQAIIYRKKQNQKDKTSRCHNSRFRQICQCRSTNR